MLGESRLPLQHHHFGVRPGRHQLAGGGQAEDPAADDDVAQYRRDQPAATNCEAFSSIALISES